MIPCKVLTTRSRRVTWKSKAARDTWLPRVQRVVETYTALEWLSVAYGVRRVASIDVHAANLVTTTASWAERGLVSLAMYWFPEYRMFEMAIGKSVADFVAMRDADARCDFCVVEDLFGYPQCCREAFKERVRSSNSAGSFVEWVRELDILPCVHLPCRKDCAPTALIEKQFADVAKREGMGECVTWLRAMRAWPITRPNEDYVEAPFLKIEAVRSRRRRGKAVK